MSSKDVTGMGAAGVPSPNFNRPVPPHNGGRTSHHEEVQTTQVSGPILHGNQTVPDVPHAHTAKPLSENKIRSFVAPHFARAGRGDGTQTKYENTLEEVENISADAPPQSYLIRTAGQPKVPSSPTQMIKIRVGVSPEKSPINKKSPIEVIKAFRNRAKEVKKNARVYHSEAVKAYQRAIVDDHKHPLSKSPSPQEICDHSTRQLTIKQAERDITFSRLVHANRDRQDTYAVWLLATKELELATLESKNIPPGLSPKEWEETAQKKIDRAKDRVTETHSVMQKADGIYKERLEKYTASANNLLEQTVKTLKILEKQSQIVYRQLKETIPKNDVEFSAHRQSVLFASNIASKITNIIYYNKNHPNAIDATQHEKLLKGILEQLKLPFSRSEEFLKAANKEVESAQAALTAFDKDKKGSLPPEQALKKTFLEYTLAQKKYVLAQKQTFVKGAQFAVNLIEFSILKSQPAPDPKKLVPVKIKLEASLLQNDQAETQEAAAKTAYMLAKEEATVDPEKKRIAHRDFLVAASQEAFFKFLQARNLTAYFAGMIAQKVPVQPKYTSAKLEAQKAKNAYMMARHKLRSTQTAATAPVLKPGRVTRPVRPPPSRAVIQPEVGGIAQSSVSALPPTTAAMPVSIPRPLPPGYRRPLPHGLPPSQMALASAQAPINAPPSAVEQLRTELQDLKDKNAKEKARIEEFKKYPPEERLKAQIDVLEARNKQNLALEKFKADQLELLEQKEKNTKLKAKIEALKQNPQSDQDEISALEAQYKQNLVLEKKMERLHLRRELANLKAEIDQLADNDPSKAPKLKLYEASRVDIWSKFPEAQTEMVLKEIVDTEIVYQNNLRVIQQLSELHKKPEFIKYLKDKYPEKADSYIDALKTISENIPALVTASTSVLSAAQKGLEQFRTSPLPEDKSKAADIAFEELTRVFGQLTTTDAYVAYVDAFNKQKGCFAGFAQSKDGEKLLNRQFEDPPPPDFQKMFSDIDATLITPIQRIPRYVLLLVDYAKKSSDTNDLGVHSSKNMAALQTTKRAAETINQFMPQAAPLRNRLLHLLAMLKRGLKLAKENNILGYLSHVIVTRTKAKQDALDTVKSILSTLEEASKDKEIADLTYKIESIQRDSKGTSAEIEELRELENKLTKAQQENRDLTSIAGQAFDALKNNRWAKRVIDKSKGTDDDLTTRYAQLEAKFSQSVVAVTLELPVDKLQEIAIILSNVAAVAGNKLELVKKELGLQGLEGNIHDILQRAFDLATQTIKSTDPGKIESIQQLIAIIKRCPWLIEEIQNDKELFNQFLSLQGSLVSSNPPIIISSNPEELIDDLTNISIKFAKMATAVPTPTKGEKIDSQIRKLFLERGVDLHAMLELTKTVFQAAKKALVSADTSTEQKKRWKTLQELTAQTTLKIITDSNAQLKIAGFDKKIEEVKALVPKEILEPPRREPPPLGTGGLNDDFADDVSLPKTVDSSDSDSFRDS